MDLSKLPKMSQTDRAPNQTEQVPNQLAFCDQCGSPLNPGSRFCPGCGRALMGSSPMRENAAPEAWLSIAIGAILWFIQPNLLLYAMNPTTTKFDAIDRNGAMIPYMKSAFFWPDLGIATFCLCLIVSGILMLVFRARWSVWVVLLLAAIACIANVMALVIATPLIGFNIMCALAAAFSVYILISQFSLVRRP